VARPGSVATRKPAGERAGITVGEALGAAGRKLRAAGIDQPGLDGRLLLGYALDVSQTELILRHDDLLETRAGRRFEALVYRRAGGEPVSRIFGRREFYGRRFRLDPAVLDPRGDTETVVECALELARRQTLVQAENEGRHFRLLDLGTGSGAILLTLLAEWPEATGIGVDISAAALRIAALNAVDLGVWERCEFVCSDWDAALAGGYDFILCNPPYIASAQIDRLDPDVAVFDPRQALDGGADGLDAYRAVAKLAAGRLADGGWLLVEIGQGQGQEVTTIFSNAGLVCCAPRPDLSGIDRVIAARVDTKTVAK